MLSVRRGAKAVEFYKSAFGADVLYRIDAPDGSVVARLSTDGAEFWVADESPEHKNFSAETLGDGTGKILLIVDSPDAAFEGSCRRSCCRLAAGKPTWLAHR
jgi:PhnB protein